MSVRIKALTERDAAAFGTEFSSSCSGFFAHPGAVAFGAFADDRPVGLVWGFVLPRPDGERMFFLYSLDVAEPYRNRGIGTDLVKAVCAYAQNEGCRKLFLITEESNPAACRCYEKAGLMPKHPDDRLYERVFGGKM